MTQSIFYLISLSPVSVLKFYFVAQYLNFQQYFKSLANLLLSFMKDGNYFTCFHFNDRIIPLINYYFTFNFNKLQSLNRLKVPFSFSDEAGFGD